MASVAPSTLPLQSSAAGSAGVSAVTVSAPPVPRGRSDAGVRGALCGGLGAMAATVCTQPLDLLKVRLQLLGELDASSVRGEGRPRIPQVVAHMLRTEGIMGFYRQSNATLHAADACGPSMPWTRWQQQRRGSTSMNCRVLTGFRSYCLSSDPAVCL
jgi:hypothetical protein